MSLLDFIQQDDTVRLSAHRFRQLAAFFVTDIAGRRTNEAGHRMFFHVFGHVKTNQGALVVKQKLGKRFSQFGFPDACRPQENKRSDGASGFFQPGPGAANRLRHSGNSLVLSNYPVMEEIFHPQEFFGFAFHQARHGNPGPAANDFRNIGFINLFFQKHRILS